MADDAVPVDEAIFACGIVHSSIRALSLPQWSGVGRCCPPQFRPPGLSLEDAEAEALMGYGAVSE